MTTAPKSMISRIALLVCALLMCLGVQAFAQDTGMVSVAVSVTPDTLAAPGEVTVSVRVTNVSGADMTDAVSLYDPSGNRVIVFGDGGSVVLKEGEFRTVQMNWAVTAEQLAAGNLTFTARYADAQVVGSAQLNASGTTDNVLQVSRTLVPEVVRTGDTASVEYEITNVGTADMSNIRVTENITKTPQTISSLKAGASAKLTFTARMGNSNLTSSARITYRVAGDSSTQTLSVGDLTIPVAVRGLNITFSADKQSVNIGDTVKLIMTAVNNGNITYNTVSVTETRLGEVFTGFSIPAGQTVVEEVEVTVAEPTRYQFTVKLTDNTGTETTLNDNAYAVPVSAFDPARELNLTLVLEADTQSIQAMPADVSMTLTVTNASNIDCKDIVISHGNVTIYTIPQLKAGQSTTLRRDYTVSQAGQFRFTATADDAIGNTVSFESNTMLLTYAAPTAAPTDVPEITVAPLVTIAPAGYSDVDSTLRTTRNVLYTAVWVLGILFVVLLALFVVSSIVRLNKKRQSGQAYDHLELADKRDYTEPKSEESEQEEIPGMESGEEEYTPVAPNDEKTQLPHERLLHQEDEPDFDIPDPVPPEMLIKPEEDKQQPEAAAAQDRPVATPESDGLGAYRMTRGESEQLANALDKQAPKARKGRRGVTKRSDSVNEEE